MISFHDEPTPICGLAKSSSPMPTARSIPRAAAFSRPSVTSRLRGLMSGVGSAGMRVIMRPAFPRPNPYSYPRGVLVGWPHDVDPRAPARRAGRACVCSWPAVREPDSGRRSDRGQTPTPPSSPGSRGLQRRRHHVRHHHGPHHQQAIELSTHGPERSTNPELIALADRIAATQQPEINILNVFLVQWNENPENRTEGAGTRTRRAINRGWSTRRRWRNCSRCAARNSTNYGCGR